MPSILLIYINSRTNKNKSEILKSSEHINEKEWAIPRFRLLTITAAGVVPCGGPIKHPELISYFKVGPEANNRF